MQDPTNNAPTTPKTESIFKTVMKDHIPVSLPITTVVYDYCQITSTASKRATLILDYLTRVAEPNKLPVRFIANTSLIANDDLNSLNVHDACYIEFLGEAYDDAETQHDNDWFKDGKLIPYHFAPANVSDQVLERLHKNHLYKLSGYYCNDDITPIIESTCRQAFQSAENSRYAAELIVRRDKENLPIRQVYALNSSPGHHARRDGYGGYCFLNNAAIAAARIHHLTNAPVAILDLDYHAGDGTQDIFYDSDKILTISIHMNPEFDYPTYSGYPEEKGRGA